MSASREKKQRQQTEALTEKERQQAREAQQAKKRTIIYTVLGAIAAILVAALLIWNSGFFQRRATAAVVGDQSFSASDLSYYYYLVKNSTVSTAQTYAQYGIDMGYDVDKAPKDQMYDEEKSYADYFRETALKNLQTVTTLASEAKKAGYELSADGQASIDEVVGQIASYSAQYGYSKQAYLKLLYGPYMTESTFLKQLALSTLAQEYQTHYTDSLTYSDAELEAYYTKNADKLDTFDYRYCFINGAVESSTDADGKEVEPSDEAKAAAMADAKTKADALIARVKAGEEFNEAAKDYVSSPDSYDDPEYAHMTDTLGSSITSYAYAEWLQSSARKTGDLGAVESAGSGYYVVYLLNRERSENTYQTADVRHILVKAELDEGATVPTEAQLNAAKAEAESLLAQWKAGAATADSFAALAKEHSEDPGSKENGGLYEGVTRGQMIASFNSWLFTPGRKTGDTGIVVNTSGSSTDVLGYHVMYFQAPGQIRWKGEAESALSTEDYNTWETAALETYPLTVKNGAALVK